jgi:hypothetical protein
MVQKFKKLYKTLFEDNVNQIESSLNSIYYKIKSEYPEVPTFESFNIYSIPKLKLPVVQEERHEEESKESHQIAANPSI